MIKYPVLWVVLALGSAAIALAGPISSVVVYGDSLSDNGNLYAAIGYPPSPPYYAGRFSNGPIAVEDLAAQLGVPLIDYAIGDATTGLGNGADGGNVSHQNTLPGMTTIFDATSSTLTPYLAGGLFIVWGGPDDFAAPDPSDSFPAGVAAHAVADLDSIVAGLATLGAHNILVLGMPDLGLTPFYHSQGPVVSAEASAVTDAFNALLVSSLPASVKYFDTAGLLRSIYAHPGLYGLTDVTDQCLVGATVCANPNQYLFWDDFHPTAAVDRIVAADLAVDVASVPEPSTAALSALSLGLIAWGLRKSRKLHA